MFLTLFNDFDPTQFIQLSSFRGFVKFGHDFLLSSKHFSLDLLAPNLFTYSNDNKVGK